MPLLKMKKINETKREQQQQQNMRNKMYERRLTSLKTQKFTLILVAYQEQLQYLKMLTLSTTRK